MISAWRHDAAGLFPAAEGAAIIPCHALRNQSILPMRRYHLAAPGKDVLHLGGAGERARSGPFGRRIAQIVEQIARHAVVLEADAPAARPVIQMPMRGQLRGLELLADLISRGRRRRIGQIGIEDIAVRAHDIAKDRGMPTECRKRSRSGLIRRSGLGRNRSSSRMMK